MTILIDNNSVTELRATNSAFVSASKSFNKKKNSLQYGQKIFVYCNAEKREF